MLSRATWRDREKSSTLRNKSVLSLMQNWAAASLMVSCGGGHQNGQNPNSPLPRPDLLTPLHEWTNEAHTLDACLGFDTMQVLKKEDRGQHHSFPGNVQSRLHPWVPEQCRVGHLGSCLLSLLPSQLGRKALQQLGLGCMGPGILVKGQ